MEIAFLLNGADVRIPVPEGSQVATTTLLDWLREERGLTGTKEGCNEGDCGACSVMVTTPDGTPKALNACILFLPQLHGKAVRTVEGLAGPSGELHPVQEAMITHHGSQCGFCTPGFVVSMVAAHANGQTNHADQIAGNLCRCTGYAPILRAARAAEGAPIPDWLEDGAVVAPDGDATLHAHCAIPRSSDELAEWYASHPDGTLIAGATDVGLWVTKGLRELTPVAFLNRCGDLKIIEQHASGLYIGAAVTLTELQEAIAPRFPGFAELIRRYGSVQVRNAATIGGNIANGSPIGDGPPALIALGAQLHLRKGETRRTLDLEDFFIEYGQQDKAPSEFVEGITIPEQPGTLACYKLSKRFDQDISAVCGCFAITVENEQVKRARIAFGGMAGTPKRAKTVEHMLIGQAWSPATIEKAVLGFQDDFAPIDDMRSSATYRMQSAKNMLARFFYEKSGIRSNVLEVES